jgi:hypothetical protein
MRPLNADAQSVGKTSCSLRLHTRFCSACLLLLPPNAWFKLHAWYLASWPASHLFARQTVGAEIGFGCGQWALIAAVWVLLFRRHRRDN